jgi:TolA-binding protein
LTQATPNIPLEAPGGRAGHRLREVWQLPVLVFAAALLLGAVIAAVMTAPRPDMSDDLAIAGRLVESGRHGEALDRLNTVILPHIARGHLKRPELAQFHLLRARALYLGQRQAGIDRTENHENVRREFTSAEKLSALLTPDDHYMLASTHLALGELDRAAKLAEALPDGDRERRLDILRAVVDRSLMARPPEYARALDTVTAITADPRLSMDDRVWALGRQGELLISTGYPQDAVAKIVRTLPRLEGAGGQRLGEVLITLGKAYIAEANRSARPEDSGDLMGEARKQLQRAASLLGPEHGLMWLNTLLLGEVDHHDGELQRARERYTEVVERFSFSEGRPVALLGLAEVTSQMSLQDLEDHTEESLRRYEELVRLFESGAAGPDLTVGRVGESLTSRFKEQYERRLYPRALQFAGLAERLYGEVKTPPELLLGVAETHKRLAELALGSAAGQGLLSLAEADPATQREAKEHLLRAGDYYRRHANGVVISDAKAYAQSLWDAADAFDRAGDIESSIAAFQQFVADFPSDTRRPEAMFRLAQGHRARGDLDPAARLYQELIESRASVEGAGPFADASYVPLAQTLLADADTGNDERGEDLLMQVLGGEITGPTTPIYRDALREMGHHFFRTGRFAGAIEKFEQYLAVAASAAGGTREIEVRFRLAEAYRRSATEIGRTLRSALPEATRRELTDDRTRRLERAAALYGEVRQALESRQARTPLDDLILRNACFYEADCAFDLTDYATAIRRYDAARERYPKDPAALVAMTQIVSALLAQGQTANARAAQSRARRFYESLPESVWDDPTLPMTREGWQRWLDAQAALADGASADEGG